MREPILLREITPARWTRIRFEAGARGLPINGDSGEAEQKGMRFRWIYRVGEETLEVQVLKKPWMVPHSMIERKLREAFGAIAA